MSHESDYFIMSRRPTHIWVKTNVLDEAIKLQRKNSSNNNSKPHILKRNSSMLSACSLSSIGNNNEGPKCNGVGDWGWALAKIIYDNTTTSTDPEQWEEEGIGDVTILVEDRDCLRHNEKTIFIPASLSKDGGVLMANCPTLEKGGDIFADSPTPDNLIELTHLHEPAVVHCLRMRYKQDKIYTATGPILLAVNPFKHCQGLYSAEKMRKYWARGEMIVDDASGDENYATSDEADYLPPHVFGSADFAFRSMMRGIEDVGVWEKPNKSNDSIKVDQSILVSGESGSGKTVTTKHIMEYLATVSEWKASSSSSTKSAEMKESVVHVMKRRVCSDSSKQTSDIEQKVIESNPILESFGNARTIRNDNSSRFGKFVELQFNSRGSLVGAAINTYLLEKVRLISQARGERNYHMFYELLAGASDEYRDKFFLGDYSAGDFRMTSVSNTFDRRDGVDDHEMFEDLITAMDTMGFQKQEQEDIFAVASALLHTSNLNVLEINDDESQLDHNNPNLEAVLSLLGFSAKQFSDALCGFAIEAGGDRHIRSLNKSKAASGLEALMKAIYNSLFEFIVGRINELIAAQPGSNKTSLKQAACIGVLDIFGFESFDKNSFEQLCINYCNEALQQQFNYFVFKNGQQEYAGEGIEWSFIEFPDNQDILDLIDKKGHGIIPLLDDLCKAPGTTDIAFATITYDRFVNNSHFEISPFHMCTGKFVILHYAGPVEYDTKGFVEKNKDEFPKEGSNLLLSSSNPFVQTLAKMIGPLRSASFKEKRRRAQSVACCFATQLKTLRKRIDNTSPHYVRCFKPNDDLAPDNLVPSLIIYQLRCTGVIEAVRVSRVGFPQRYSHAMFVQRYRTLALKEFRKDRLGSHREQCERLIRAIARQLVGATKQSDKSDDDGDGETRDAVDINATGIQMGASKVFLRNRAFERLERLRLEVVNNYSTPIQSAARRFLAYREFRNALRSMIMIQSAVRIFLATTKVQRKRCSHAATVIQSAWRGGAAQKRYVAIVGIAIWCQRMRRGHLGRETYSHFRRERKSLVIQTWWRKHRDVNCYQLLRQYAIVIQCFARSRLARNLLRKLKEDAKDLMALRVERDDLLEELEAVKCELHRTRQQMEDDSMSQEVQHLREQLEQAQLMQKEIQDKAFKEVERIQIKAESLKAELEETKQITKEIETASSDALHKKDQQITELEDLLEEQKNEASILLTEKSIMGFEMGTLREEVTVLKRSEVKISHDLEQFKIKAENLKAELEETKQRSEEFEIASSDASNKKDEEIVELKMQLKETKNEALVLANETSSVLREIGILQQDIAALKDSEMKASIDLGQFRNEAALLKSLFEDTKKHSGDTVVPSNESSEQGTEIEELKRQLKLAKGEAMKMEIEKNSMVQEMGILRKEVAVLTKNSEVKVCCDSNIHNADGDLTLFEEGSHSKESFDEARQQGSDEETSNVAIQKSDRGRRSDPPRSPVINSQEMRRIHVTADEIQPTVYIEMLWVNKDQENVEVEAIEETKFDEGYSRRDGVLSLYRSVLTSDDSIMS